MGPRVISLMMLVILLSLFSWLAWAEIYQFYWYFQCAKTWLCFFPCGFVFLISSFYHPTFLLSLFYFALYFQLSCCRSLDGWFETCLPSYRTAPHLATHTQLHSVINFTLLLNFFFVFLSETGPRYVAKAGLELAILLPQSPECCVLSSFLVLILLWLN